MEEYRSGHTGLVSKTKRGVIYTWVRIPPPPPFAKRTMTEGLKTTEQIQATSTSHIYQLEPRLLENPYFGEALRKPDGGICWAASIAMCASAHTGLPSEALLSAIGRFTYDLFPNHFAEIQRDIRNTYGNDAALPFVQEGLRELVTANGGLSNFYLLRYPSQTATLLRYMLVDSMGLELQITIPLSLASLHNKPHDLNNELLKLQPTRTCVMGVTIELYGRNVHRSSNHMVWISGIKRAINCITY